MDLNGDIQFSRKISDGLLLFPARMVTDADFGDAVALDEVGMTVRDPSRTRRS